MAEIAQKIGRDKSTVTALTDKLVKLGYVCKERSAEDTRVVHVTLTSRGNELKPVFEEISREIMKAFYQNISEEEEDQLIRILDKIYAGL
jgi:DNA-binding MarR family transcriptional regulator